MRDHGNWTFALVVIKTVNSSFVPNKWCFAFQFCHFYSNEIVYGRQRTKLTPHFVCSSEHMHTDSILG